MRITAPTNQTQAVSDGVVGLADLANATFVLLGTNRSAATSLLELVEDQEKTRVATWLTTHVDCAEFHGELDPSEWLFRPKPVVRPLLPRPPTIAPIVTYVLTFAESKLARRSSVDNKSVALIGAGFTVDGKTFSASDTAQLKWLGMYTSRADLSYPVTVPAKDDLSFVSLIEAADIATYYAALLARIQTVLSGGVTLKAQIAAATNQAALDAIVDDRT